MNLLTFVRIDCKILLEKHSSLFVVRVFYKEKRFITLTSEQIHLALGGKYTTNDIFKPFKPLMLLNSHVNPNANAKLWPLPLPLLLP
jgi:hypothetical protein